MVCVRVPATSANMAAGFDCLGVAVSLYFTIWLEEAETDQVYVKDREYKGSGGNNLILQAVRKVYDACGKPSPGFLLVQESCIPTTRGLGSSSACIVAGMVAANALLGAPLSKEQLLDLAAQMEGHPDNVMPALYGGFCVGVFENGHVSCVHTPVKKRLRFAAFIPKNHLKTSASRGVLPQEIAFSDGVFNLSHASLMTATMLTGRYDLLATATQDKLHQPYRFPLIRGAEQVIDIAKESGALAVYLSGAGSTLMALVPDGADDFFQRAKDGLRKQELFGFRLRMLRADNRGAVILDKPCPDLTV